jgi:RNA polymerase sigma-70 factor (ECF subfamily)
LTEPGAESEFERARRAAGERALIAAAAGGSASAFETLYRSHVGKVYGLCLRMTANPTIAEDCAQDAFVQAWRSLPTFEARSSFGTWLHRIAVNAVLARGRRRLFFFNDTATTEIYTILHTLSLHGALPILALMGQRT